MRKLLSAALALMPLAAIAGPYKVTFPVPDHPDSTLIYMYNYDSGEKIDSCYSQKNVAVFTGEIDEPVPAVMAVTKPLAQFVLEEGSFTFNENRSPAGSMLNDRLTEEYKGINEKIKALSSAQSEEEYNALFGPTISYIVDALIRNADTPVGYLIFRDIYSALDGQQLIGLVDGNPSLKAYTKVQKAYDGAQNRIATSEGNPYRDFTVTYNGVAKSLSDYVGKGQYVLVDFWASWCGPCMREMPVLKEIYDEYSPKGLKMLGVAVWDKPADTEAAIERLQLPWEVIIDAQTVPTDIYGITGIPSLIVFSPDGTIISRDLRGEQLKEFIANLYKDKK